MPSPLRKNIVMLSQIIYNVFPNISPKGQKVIYLKTSTLYNMNYQIQGLFDTRTKWTLIPSIQNGGQAIKGVLSKICLLVRPTGLWTPQGVVGIDMLSN